MNHKQIKKLLILSCVAATLVACDVKQTEDGKMPDVDVSSDGGQVPKYEVTKTQEGKMPDVDVNAESGEMPEFEVETADVEVGTTQKQVDVPDVDVDMEETEMTVPSVDVDMPDEEGDEAGANN